MSTDSFAVFRKSMGDDMAKLAQPHYRDLPQSDRETLQTAAKKLSTYTFVGSAVGLGLGLFLAYRLRANRTRMFEAFRASERPTHVQFAGGRTEPIPNIEPYLKPSTLGDIATYSLFGLGGVFLGGEMGLLSGSWAAGRTITRDPESRKRIEVEFRKFRAEVLRAEADLLERGGGSLFRRGKEE